jgi:SAM-dependent methyltransferase
MNVAEYAEMYKLETFYWWFVSRRQLLNDFVRDAARSFARPAILDVGCGTGINHSVLSKYGMTVCTDPSHEAVTFSRSRGIGELAQSQLETLPFPAATFDIVTALDVLEHVDDDMRAMREILRVTKDGGVLLVTVPAYGFLWSEHDEALHHRRRYAASELRNKLTNAGFEVERITYYMSLLFFPILFIRFLQSLTKRSIEAKTSHIILPGWLNSTLIGILSFERGLLRVMNLPFGVSIVCTARKLPAGRPR